ncbi:MAG: alanine:cation symporter family protein [Pirellulales bacterium]|nr:alanine:cation symporter family protein [Pirellulales bacterium]
MPKIRKALTAFSITTLLAIVFYVALNAAIAQTTEQDTAGNQQPAEESPDPDGGAQKDANNKTDDANQGGEETEEPKKLSAWEKQIKRIDDWFKTYLVEPSNAFLGFDFGTGKFSTENGKKRSDTSVPFIVAWLLAGGVFFTLRMGFINVRAFWHAIRLTKGDYDDPAEQGEVSHFQALSSALSATVGLGNIAGVAIAVGLGGPGAVFWMIIAGIFGMSLKFAECSMGQIYRKIAPDGTVSGGPMRYLKDGLAEYRLGAIGFVLATIYAFVCLFASFAGGCMFQVNQSMNAINAQILEVAPGAKYVDLIYGGIMVVAVGLVIIGGIKRIATAASVIVPFMCGMYVLVSLYILLTNSDEIGPAFGTIFRSAFTMESIYGGFVGVMVIGIKRAVFSNEAGTGSASIAHSAAKTDEPISEGIVALLEPFIDTIVVCTMTGLVIVITGVFDTETNPAMATYIDAQNGAALTTAAWRSQVPWFPWLLCLAVVLFAFSTMISWSYYGERCWSHLFGARTSLVYRIIFLGFVFLGAVATATNVVNFSDNALMALAIPNIVGLVLMSGKLRGKLDDYWTRYKNGELEPATKYGKK